MFSVNNTFCWSDIFAKKLVVRLDEVQLCVVMNFLVHFNYLRCVSNNSNDVPAGYWCIFLLMWTMKWYPHKCLFPIISCKRKTKLLYLYQFCQVFFSMAALQVAWIQFCDHSLYIATLWRLKMKFRCQIDTIVTSACKITQIFVSVHVHLKFLDYYNAQIIIVPNFFLRSSKHEHIIQTILGRFLSLFWPWKQTKTSTKTLAQPLRAKGKKFVFDYIWFLFL